MASKVTHNKENEAPENLRHSKKFIHDLASRRLPLKKRTVSVDFTDDQQEQDFGWKAGEAVRPSSTYDAETQRLIDEDRLFPNEPEKLSDDEEIWPPLSRHEKDVKMVLDYHFKHAPCKCYPNISFKKYWHNPWLYLYLPSDMPFLTMRFKT